MTPEQRRELYPRSEAEINIITGIIFSLITFGIYAMYWQYKQMETLNAWQEEEEYGFFKYFVLSIITCGIYAIYTEYKMSNTINQIQMNNRWQVNGNLAVICIFLSLFFSPIASLAIQQSEINAWYDEVNL